ncbi:MAG: response regulator [Chloroflexi bacterium]|nr:response regulator [Chloroflexota bacterium]
MAKILIVDDRPINRHFLGYVLGFASHTVLEAADGEEALEIARIARPDLLIADIVMGNMDGIQLAREIRGDPSIARMPIIFYTAMYRERERPAIPSDCGACAVLPKPSDPKEILSLVQKVLGLPPSPLPQAPGEAPRQAVAATDLPAEVKRAMSGLRLSTVIEVGLDLAAQADPARLVEKLCRAARDIIGAGLAVVAVIDEEGHWPGHVAAAPVGAVSGGHVPDQAVLTELMGSTRPKRLRGFPSPQQASGTLADSPPIQSFLGVPIASAKRAYGAMYLCNKLDAGEFSDEDERIGVTLASQLALAYENTLLASEIRRNAEQLKEEVVRRSQTEQELERLNRDLLANVRQREHAEQEVREVLFRSIGVQEEERRSISRDLHDQTGQLLTGLRMLLDRISRSPGEDNAPVVEEAKCIVADLLDEVRTMAFQLRPSTLDDLGLIPTLLQHFQQYTKHTQVRVDFHHEDLPARLPDNISLGAYRIVQEALTNIARHAGVKKAMVRVWVRDNRLFVQIADSGKGFELSPVLVSSGISGMHERARLLGGKLSVASTPDRGTTITLEAPLPESSD